jgi:hypothetical protein
MDLVLVMSVFITNDRPKNRYPRLDVFKYTLQSYSIIPFKKLYLYIELDKEFQNKKDHLEGYIKELFPNTPIKLQWKRKEYQSDWQDLVTEIVNDPAPPYVWFAQCDDHVFIEKDISMLEEGLEAMRTHPHPFKTLYYSHWPEIIRLASIRNPSIVGGYLHFKENNADSIQVMSPDMFRYFMQDIDWKGQRLIKIDYISTESFYGMSSGIQTVFVPLKEMCRHFDGYGHVGMSEADCPSLLLPPERNDFSITIDRLIKCFTAPHTSAWTLYQTSIPYTWIIKMLNLYGYI